jgi:hypothetical protein
LDEATKAEAEARDLLNKGSTLVSFDSPLQKKTFFEASQKIKQQDIVIAPTQKQAVERNIEINGGLGRTPTSVDANGIPVYAPGKSYFRAMLVKPGDEQIAKKVLAEDGWKSGYDRGVKIDQNLLGSPGNGATRLSDQAPLEDSVIEFVGPKVNLGKGFENGFSFPRDSRVVGTASSSAVIEVARQTAGNAPKGSFIMLTEMVPRNRKIINSKKLLDGREIESKFPLTYQDGGVEHAVSGVETDEIVNVIYIPVNPGK